MKWVLCLLVVPLATGCVTVAEFRKLENEVTASRRANRGDVPRERLADLAARLELLEQRTEQLDGRVEVAEHRAQAALEEARTARQEVATASVGGQLANLGASPPGGSPTPGASTSVSEEMGAYRAGYAEWRSGSWDACIDRFRDFLQTYPSSAYADDAAYWLADCYFKQGDYKTAILRFDDVVSSYPDGNKAAEALYRQGEALLKLGPGFGKAAGKAFERVVSEYPGSGRANAAQRQLELLGTG